MGVKHLNTYLNRGKPNAYCYSVDIVELAKKYAINEQKKPVIVVDGTASLYRFIDFKYEDWLMGGQLRVCKTKLQKFVEAFKAEEIKLVFFFDGSVVEKKRHVWVERQTVRNNRQKRIFKDLKNGKMPTERLLPPLLGACGRFIYLQELGCEVYVSVGECDEEMAMYARKHNCFAFLANDTDFVIHKGAQYFLSMENFDDRTMRTLCFDRTELAKSLSLDDNHLPLLASLMGNDMVPSYKLEEFHKRICKGRVDVFNLVPRLAKYIEKFPSSDLCRSHLTEVAADVFRNSDMTGCLENSIGMYDCSSTQWKDKNWNVMLEAKERHKACRISRLIYPILNGQPYELSVGLEEFDGKMEAAAKVYRPMRQRLYGVLFHDDPAHTDKVEEWCVEADKISETPLKVKVIKVPDGSHPGLLKLWTGKTPQIVKNRLTLFMWCISPELSVSALKQIPKTYRVPATALYYILHFDKHLLADWEVDVLISQAVLLQTMTDNQLMRLAAQTPDPRAVQVASLFGRGITKVLLVMAACGISLNKAMPWEYYDGRLFLQQYMLAKENEKFKFQRSVEVQAQADFESIQKFVHG